MRSFIVTVLLALGLSSPVLADDAGIVTVPAFVAPGAVLDAGPAFGTPGYMAPEQPSPIATPSPTTPAPEPPTVDSITKAWKGGAFVAAGILALYLILGVLAKLDKRHALYIAAGLGAIGVLVEAASRGETPTFAQLFGAVTVFWAIVSKGPTSVPKGEGA